MFKVISAAISMSCALAGAAAALETGTVIATPCPARDCDAGISLAYVGAYTIESGTVFDNIEYGGISGLDFDPATNRYLALSDDRSEKAPARFYELSIDASASGLSGVKVERTVTLKDRDGAAYAPKSVDPESIRLAHGRIYWTSEGDGKQLLAPSVRIADRDGKLMQELPLPKGFAPTADKTSGIRDNQAFEGMTLLPQGDIIVSTEQALQQDGPTSSPMNGGLSRFIRYDGATGSPKAQYVYTIEPVPAVTEKGGGDNGVSEILALDDRRLLVVERSYTPGFGNTIRVYLADLQGASDVSSIASLAANNQSIIPLRKTLVLDLTALGLKPDNIECVSFGKGKDGSDLLIFAADNNFSKHQTSQVIAFKLLARPHGG